MNEIKLKLLVLCLIETIVITNSYIISDTEKCPSDEDLKKSFPAAKVSLKNSNHFCYANILLSRWLLGSASCLSDKIKVDDYIVELIGTSDSSNIDKIIKSPRYNPTLGAGYDLALIKLKSGFDTEVVPICLIGKDRLKTMRLTDCYLKDFRLGSQTLERIVIDTTSNSKCKQVFESAFDENYMLCVNQTNCKENRGAPIVCKDQNHYYLSAMASWGRDCPSPSLTTTATTLGYTPVDAFTKLYNNEYIDWINTTIHLNK